MSLYAQATPRWEGQLTLEDGNQRYVKRFGESGSAVVFGIHDGPGVDHRLCEPLAAVGGDGIDVVLYDQLGGGRSTRLDAGHDWTVAEFVSEIAMLASALEVDRVHLVGQCWGGILALECALREPDLVQSLVLCNGAARMETLAAGCEELVAGSPNLVREAIARGGTFDPGADLDAERGLLELYARHIRRCHPFDLERSCQEFSEWVVPILEDLGPAYLALWGANDFIPSGPLKGWDLTSRLAEISAPTMVVSGLHDAVSLACGRELVEGLPDARWLILGQSSHFPLFEAEVNTLISAIRGFVLEHAGPPRSATRQV